MVDFLKKPFKKLIFTACAVVLCFSGCTVDLLGLFGSNDLSVRFKERNNLKYIKSKGWESLSLGSNEYSFLIVSDTHIENGDAFGLERIKNVILGDNTIKFAAFTGDITQCAEKKDFNKFFEIADSLGIPCYPVIGNHDVYFNNWDNWKNLIGSTCYRIDDDAGWATLLILDTANGSFGDDQLNWLKKQLKTAKGRVFAFTHTNFFVDNPTDIQQLTDPRERAKVCSMLKGRCDTMFTGHLHSRVINDVGGVHYLCIEDFRVSKAYCVVSVSPNGISYRFGNL